MNATIELPGTFCRHLQPAPATPWKLNLGCGNNPVAGFLNVDKFRPGWADAPGALAQSFERWDMEVAPWPLPDASVDTVVLSHVLEHVGRDPDVFCRIVRELYRVCVPDAQVHIAVPHPRHNDFINDPTHVRPVTREVLGLFSMKNCLEWQRAGAANSPLAMYHGVDFEVVRYVEVFDQPHWGEYQAGDITTVDLQKRARELNNVVKELKFTLRVMKPARTKANLLPRGVA